MQFNAQNCTNAMNGVPEEDIKITTMMPDLSQNWVQMEETQLNGFVVNHYQLRVFDVEETQESTFISNRSDYQDYYCIPGVEFETQGYCIP